MQEPPTSPDQKQKKTLETRLRAVLSGIIDRRTGKDVLTGGLVTGHSVRISEAGARATITLELPGGPGQQNDRLSAEIEEAARAIDGIADVALVQTSHRAAPKSPAQRPAGGHANPLGLGGKTEGGKTATEEKPIPGVKHVIAIASGKGGVGKSTLAANLAAAFAQAGFRTGLVDADISGPSLPVLFGLKSRAEFRDGKIQPMLAHGVKAMSIGLLVSEDKAVAWRGPMVMGAVRQLFTDVDWGELDILFVDTPPGTGDAHLTLLQKIPVSGAVIISTPQEMALADVRRGAALFTSMNTPVLGIVENMAWFALPDGSRQRLFGEGGVARTAAALGLDVLATLPLEPAIATASDAGRPYVLEAPQSESAGVIRDIAVQIAAKLALVPAGGDA
ncbi:Mrp/NBP35 family ATP-binding protein [Aquisalinus flavus]|uniref:Mrp/NBP35 family ATP-binding protein n=1 Tax=Aquisalinus flavus TaxID=1526572 RepID=UPI0030CA4A45